MGLIFTGFVTGGIVTFVIGGVFAFLLRKILDINVAGAAFLDIPFSMCEANNITTSTDCNIRTGISKVYYAKYTDIDWAAMAADATKFNPATQTILGFTMVGGAKFAKISFDKKEANYTAIYSQDTGLYTDTISMNFKGKGAEIRNAITNLIGCCNLVAVVYDNNGGTSARVFGVDWDGTVFDRPITDFKVGTHEDNSGTFGNNDGGDKLDLVGETLYAPIYANVASTSLLVI